MICTSILAILLTAFSYSPQYKEAVRLYEAGMYDRARTEFQSLPDNALTDGYELLCDIKLNSALVRENIYRYEERYFRSTLSNDIYMLYSESLFDAGNFDKADEYLSKVGIKSLRRADKAALLFRQGYCDYERLRYDEAAAHFSELESMSYFSVYQTPARYALGYMCYTRGEFDEARGWFSQCVDDLRFASEASYYLLECHFMEGDYGYVKNVGEELFQTVPVPRKPHLARMMAEAYLVTGDAQKAREYYGFTATETMTRSDYFFAGSLLYGAGDYEAAIENYSSMTDRSDSIGQIASYNLAGACLKTHRKVAALDAFKEAASLSFNPVMQEDAWFNYAKLAFDLNHDTQGFESYIARYSTSKRGEQIYSYMALSALVNRDYAAAVAAYDKLERLDEQMQGNYMKANFLRGSQLYTMGAWSDAIPCFHAATFYLPKTNRFNQLARYWLAECYYKTGNYSQAEKLYMELYNQSALYGSEEGNILPYNTACSLYKQGEYKQAAVWFRMYAGSSSALYRNEAITNVADCDFALGNYKAAVASYQAVIDACGLENTLYPLYRKAMSQGLSSDKKGKVASLSPVMVSGEGLPFRDDCLYELGRAYLDIRNYSDAIKVFESLRSSSSNPEFGARSLIGMGMVYRNQSKYDPALEAYKQVVSDYPSTKWAEEALMAIESIYKQQGQSHKYLEYVEQNKGLSLSKSDKERESMYFSAAEQLYLAENYEQALSSLEKYIGSYPDGEHRAEAEYYMGDCYRHLGDKEKACAHFALSTGGDYAEMAWLNLASLQYSIEHFAEASAAYDSLYAVSRFDVNRKTALQGKMRSGFRSQVYADAIAAADKLLALELPREEIREAKYLKAKSLMALSRRPEALAVFGELKADASSAEGAEANYIFVQDMFDRGDLDGVEKAVYEFSPKSGEQYYWLARCFIVLGDTFNAKGLKDQARATFESIRDGYAPASDDDILGIVKQRIEKL